MTKNEMTKIVDTAIENFKGDIPVLQAAIGTLYTGQRYGWKVLILMHDKKTIRRYEKLLDVNFREVLPEVGDLAEKSLAWRAAQKVSNFWKAVSGEIKGIRSPHVK